MKECGLGESRIGYSLEFSIISKLEFEVSLWKWVFFGSDVEILGGYGIFYGVGSEGLR